MKRILMYPHGGCGNHGCEAIVRTTLNLIQSPQVILFSDNPLEDYRYLGTDLVDVRNPRIDLKRTMAVYYKALLQNWLFHSHDAFDKASFSPIIDLLDRNTLLLSIGGDNYCYGDNEYIYLVNRYAKKAGAQTVLWGCSIEPAAVTDAMAADLQGYDLIVARESISYEALLRLNPHTVLFPDPAFTLPKQNASVMSNHQGAKYIGINISPLIQKYETIDGITLKNYIRLVKMILLETDYSILLIPHVCKTGNNDSDALSLLRSCFPNEPRLIEVEDQNCMQLKSIISQCKLFVGARTHSTIAAYSSCVPTLVIGYSTKSRGIATDLFGTDENYVLPVQDLVEETTLVKAFAWLMEHQQEIRNRLGIIMPAYQARCEVAAKLVKEMVQK